MAKEIWKPVVGLENSYRVSNLGRVKSINRMVAASQGGGQTPKAGRLLILSVNRQGYKYVGLCENGKRRTLKVHRLVAIALSLIMKVSHTLIISTGLSQTTR
jgi:hypothetical protein